MNSIFQPKLFYHNMCYYQIPDYYKIEQLYIISYSNVLADKIKSYFLFSTLQFVI